MTKIMFIDTETIGLPITIGFDNYHHPSNTIKYNTSRVIELGYMIYENDKLVKEFDSLIVPDKFEIFNTHIHGITQTDAESKGKSIVEVFSEMLKDLEDVDCIIAHNVLFDINVILAECYRYKFEKLINKIERTQVKCTQKIGKKKMNLYKYPKLIELYKFLFSTELKQDHRALSDTKACADCYFKMVL
jgi:DNA polymerase III epsilon subunit-like protein